MSSNQNKKIKKNIKNVCWVLAVKIEWKKTLIILAKNKFNCQIYFLNLLSMIKFVKDRNKFCQKK